MFASFQCQSENQNYFKSQNGYSGGLLGWLQETGMQYLDWNCSYLEQKAEIEDFNLILHRSIEG